MMKLRVDLTNRPIKMASTFTVSTGCVMNYTLEKSLPLVEGVACFAGCLEAFACCFFLGAI